MRNRGPSASNKHRRKRTKKHKKQQDLEEEPRNNDNMHLPDALPVQHFHMDFGFVRGSNYTIKQEDEPTVTSKYGYNSYLLTI